MYIIICVSPTKSLCISKNWMLKTLFHFKTTSPLPFSHMIVWHTTSLGTIHVHASSRQAISDCVISYVSSSQSFSPTNRYITDINYTSCSSWHTHTAIQTWNSLVWWNKLLISKFICTFLQYLIKSWFKQKFHKHESLLYKK